MTATILVVDDELFFRSLYAELLGGEEYQVETVCSGEEALIRLQSGGVDVVLTDLVMPGLGGMELLRRVRSLENPPEVILATGHATLETAIEALKNGARDYLIKPFKPEELLHLIRTCVEQRRLLDENILLKSQIRLFQRGQSLASMLEIDRLLPQAVTTLLHELAGGRGFAFLATQSGVSQVRAIEGLAEEEAFALAESLSPRFVDLNALCQLPASELTPASGWPDDVRSVLLIPLRCERSIKGGMLLFNTIGSDLPTPLSLHNIQFLSDQAALGFENAFRYQGARELIYTDDLTGLFNYRYMQVFLEQEVRRTERYGLSFSLVFIDLDHFKGINDTRGHLAGSESLREIAYLLRKCVREVDVLFRYGGDEFTALLVETDVRGAGVVAERIRRSIEQHIFLAGTTNPARLTATLGYATFPEHAGDKKSIIDIADRAMYEGKKDRNIVRGAWELK
ncbi:MAG: hypothetical protein A2091_00650 [Desulfuromonadales bacterium GWD2_61_12]|nr:MAG: hypothetical protein A2091_00650 [Desulfuromonadales bacterium GWD2_61_12]OGR34032.1 MAG: hypothetical protein A2005_03170 [Desulfuromonadales bacterium GWC2_61_20]